MKLWRLEALRGFAAFYVVLHHTLPHHWLLLGIDVGTLLRFGQEAVILFFLLSGFVINYSFRSASDRSFKTYFRKRFIRIYVPLIPVLAVSYLLAAWAKGAWIDPAPMQLLGNLFMLQDSLKPNVIVYPYMGNLPLWSLSYEWWFYMLYFPLARSALAWWQQAAVVAVAAVIAAAIYTHFPTAVARWVMYFSIWWAGVYLGEIYCRNLVHDLKAWIYPAACLAFIGSILTIGAIQESAFRRPIETGLHPFLEIRHFGFASISLVVALIWSKTHWAGFRFFPGPFEAVAPISYALYIGHYPLLANANYLSFMHFPIVEKLLYIFILIFFCSVLELKLYPLFSSLFAKKHDRGLREPKQLAAPSAAESKGDRNSRRSINALRGRTRD